MILAPRYIPRIAATVGLFTRYGLLDFAKRQGLTSIEGLGAAEGQPGSDKDIAEAKDKAVAFRERLVELGPAYIKLGQVLSTRPDLMPPTYIKELEHLRTACSRCLSRMSRERSKRSSAPASASSSQCFDDALGLVGIIIAVGLAMYVLITVLVSDRNDKQSAATE